MTQQVKSIYPPHTGGGRGYPPPGGNPLPTWRKRRVADVGASSSLSSSRLGGLQGVRGHRRSEGEDRVLDMVRKTKCRKQSVQY